MTIFFEGFAAGFAVAAILIVGGAALAIRAMTRVQSVSDRRHQGG